MKRASMATEFTSELMGLSDEELADEARRLYAGRCENEARALAVVREAVRRSEDIMLTVEQLACACALIDGDVAEASTGSGKTLAAMPAAFVLASRFGQCHVATVNEYLAHRDAVEASAVLGRLGVTVASTLAGDGLDAKHGAYAADVVYGQASEFGFDYLRDGIAHFAGAVVQTGRHACIVDEVDSVLIDDARTPLIISGANATSAKEARLVADAVRGLSDDKDMEIDRAERTCVLTGAGEIRVEAKLPWKIRSTPAHANLVRQALMAEYLYQRDRDYIVRGGKVEIVDEQTGRVMEGRRWNDGLHAAVEAKEGVEIQPESQTMASVSYQNYFRGYEHLSGMTGTAASEDREFDAVFGMRVSIIPDHVESRREDLPDVFFATDAERMAALVEDIRARHEKGQPVLVGTQSVEQSDEVADALARVGIEATVLNARDNEAESAIVAAAGKPGHVTVSTNMAGRGTDIKLGGSAAFDAEAACTALGTTISALDPLVRAERLAKAAERCEEMRGEVVAAGGLAVVSVGRNKNRRIDDQLRGRSGRQGDPGETQFYLSLEDDLMRLFGGDRMDKISAMMQRYDMPDDMPIQAKMVTKAVESAQRKVEEVNFAMRKNVLDYDNVMNTQRQVIYEERNKILDGKDLMEHIDEVTYDTVQREVATYCPESAKREEWDLEGLGSWLSELTGRKDVPDASACEGEGEVIELVDQFVDGCFAEKAERLGSEAMHALSAQVMLRVIDTRWMAYLQEMDYLKTGIGLRGFGQRDPLVEYKSEAYAAFAELVNTMYEDFLRTILRIEVVVRQPAAPQAAPADEEPAELRGAHYSGPSEVDGDQGARRAPAPRHAAPARPAAPAASKPRTYRKSDDPDPYVGVGRNDPCPCGSGKKFKNCHGRNR